LSVNLHTVNTQQVMFRDLGEMDYRSAWELQEKLLQENVTRKMVRHQLVGSRSGSDLPPDADTRHHLLFVEHPAVFTLGKSGKMENVLVSEDELKLRNIEFFKTNRGGDITFHGPQQIVGYPVLDLEKFYTDIGKYLRSLEEMIIGTLEEYGIKAGRSPGETGVWIDPEIPGKERKICAIGVRSSRWITMHGFALNVNTDLSYFNHIIPCGIGNKMVTSIERELGQKVDFADAKQKVKRNFEKVFGVQLVSAEGSND
jgi:lipoyl(octanoyl) transferase